MALILCVLKVSLCVLSCGRRVLGAIGAGCNVQKRRRLHSAAEVPFPNTENHNRSTHPPHTTEPCHSSQGKCSLHNRYRGKKCVTECIIKPHPPTCTQSLQPHDKHALQQPNYTVQTHNLQCMRVCGHGQPLLLQVTQV